LPRQIRRHRTRGIPSTIQKKTGSAILASSDETKTFTYSDDTISYSVTALGVTKKVILERADIDVP